MAAPYTSESRSYETLLTTTAAKYEKTVADQISKANGLYYVLNKPNVKKMQNGGERVEVPLRVIKSSSGGWYDSYDILNVNPANPLTKAFYDWKQLYYSVTMSRKEERQNSGEGRIINMLQKLFDDARDALTEDLNIAFFGSTASKAAQGLQSLIIEVPTSGAIGGITRNTTTNAFWANKVVGEASLTWVARADATPSAATGWIGMEQLYENCSKGGGPAGMRSPNVCMANQIGYRRAISSLEPQRRFTNTELAKVGFDNVMFNNMAIMWDELTASATATVGHATVELFYMINTNFMHLYVDSETDFYTTPFVRPYNQDVRTMQYLWMGQLCVSAMRKHGVLVGSALTEYE